MRIGVHVVVGSLYMGFPISVLCVRIEYASSILSIGADLTFAMAAR